ncbi:PREDICTED: fibropellin-1-like [Branchiostoma belcheri]|uniref:Fibropellin-1-like n=1 Tax=Branchiostoma belcheri TaxID=7741 RepID=A0A6P4Z664_BRABE|nr:PREDICTED: fibropellin-1-like [Branchiostoma belcheri]
MTPLFLFSSTFILLWSTCGAVIDITVINKFPFVLASPSRDYTYVKCVTPYTATFGALHTPNIPRMSFSRTFRDEEADWPGQDLMFFSFAGDERIGGFQCSAGGEEVAAVKMYESASFIPPTFSLTLNRGDTATIRMAAQQTQFKSVRWKRNGVAITNSGSTYVIRGADPTRHEGVYRCYYDGEPEDGAMIRVIVRGCQENRWGPGCTRDCPNCLHGGMCHSDTGECICPPGFRGDRCEIPCGSNRFGLTCSHKCDNSGNGDDACADLQFCLPDPYGCSCNTGFRGLRCDTACSAGTFGAGCTSTCHCRDDVTCDRFTGECPGNTCACGWEGRTCQDEKRDYCDSAPCENGGTCSYSAEEDTCFVCACPAGFTGQVCETDIDECESTPCQNGGICTDRVNSYVCDCPDGYTGDNCEEDIDECQSSPCQNGGTCFDDVNSFTCACREGYSGDTCEDEGNECESSPCQNGGTCHDQVNSYTCSCAPGYLGDNCETDVDECWSNPCQNGGTCNDDVNSFSCTCPKGFIGNMCEEEMNECDSNPCQNGGSCADLLNGYNCACPVGYRGVNCEETDQCSPNPCLNGGNCSELNDTYICACPENFSGVHCEIDDADPTTAPPVNRTDPCALQPCQNGGTCELGLVSYTCRCTSGFVGDNCELQIPTFPSYASNTEETMREFCSINPCENGGTCVSNTETYVCFCPDNHYGRHCEKTIINGGAGNKESPGTSSAIYLAGAAVGGFAAMSVLFAAVYKYVQYAQLKKVTPVQVMDMKEKPGQGFKRVDRLPELEKGLDEAKGPGNEGKQKKKGKKKRRKKLRAPKELNPLRGPRPPPNMDGTQLTDLTYPNDAPATRIIRPPKYLEPIQHPFAIN